jgi:hypothetical protein
VPQSCYLVCSFVGNRLPRCQVAWAIERLRQEREIGEAISPTFTAAAAATSTTTTSTATTTATITTTAATITTHPRPWKSKNVLLCRFQCWRQGQTVM